ncbi:uncharacterized protein C10orf95-like [Mustela erminea]|uniref:uncharacterized protein C10orf95-like n=1 Tax=Mustela erminea TaxID=36723 RepID=UPI0013866353|nr:uncharacterized protein C10orf95-like [Mustela erminea]
MRTVPLERVKFQRIRERQSRGRGSEVRKQVSRERGQEQVKRKEPRGNLCASDSGGKPRGLTATPGTGKPGRGAGTECQWGRPPVKAATRRPRRSSSHPMGDWAPTRRPGQPGVPPSSRDSQRPGSTHPGPLGLRPVPPSWAPPAPPLRPRLRRSRRPRSQRRAETAAGRARAGRAQEIPARFRGSAAAAAAAWGRGRGRAAAPTPPAPLPAEPRIWAPARRGTLRAQASGSRLW